MSNEKFDSSFLFCKKDIEETITRLEKQVDQEKGKVMRFDENEGTYKRVEKQVRNHNHHTFLFVKIEFLKM